MLINLLEKTGLQYVNIEVDTDKLAQVQESSRTFFEPRSGAGNLPPAEFFPGLIAPVGTGDQGVRDSNGEEIGQERLFRIDGRTVLEAFDMKWLPLPYTLRMAGESGTEVDSNNWVRLWYSLRPSYEYSEDAGPRFVLCVDTESALEPSSTDFSPFLTPNLGKPFALSPLSPSFWRSTPMKGWIKRLGRHIPPGHEKLDRYPAFSHYLALLTLLAGGDMLPTITISRALGTPLDVHLFLDVGNSRTCGIIAECLPGARPGPDSFEKLAIRNYYSPDRTFSEPFPTTVGFIPSPFDPTFDPDMDWSPNFRILSPLRVGDTVQVKLGGSAIKTPGPSVLSSPKRYLWSTDQTESPWYFAMTNTGAESVIKGDLLNEMDENGYPRHWGRSLVPLEPRYPRSAMMTFFMVEILGHVLSQINSHEYRRSKENPGNKRLLKSIVVTTPNGMVEVEKEIYKKRVEAALEFARKFYSIPEAGKPTVHLGDYDEATCVQLVYLYASIKDKFLDDADSFFEHFGRRRNATKSGRNFPSMRVASIDIGGGTSDLMIAEHMDTIPGPMTFLQSRPLFQEGISVAGDEVVRNIISDLILDQMASQSHNIFFREVDIGVFQDIFGPAPIDRSPAFRDGRKKLIEEMLIPMAHKFLEHSETREGEDVVTLGFHEMFSTDPEHHKKFLGDSVAKVLGDGFAHLPQFQIEWEIDRRKVDRVIMTTLAPVLRIFSQVIAQYNCDMVVLGGRISALPVVREMMVTLCPVPPSRIVSLTGFPAGAWYPFDVRQGKIKDAKTTVAVGAALWFFAEKLNAITNFGMASHRERIRANKLFIGAIAGPKLNRSGVLFPPAPGGMYSLSLAARTFLGTRRIDSESSHANVLYEVSLAEGVEPDLLPLQVFFSQAPKDPSALTISRVMDRQGAPVPAKTVRLKLRTLEEDLYWLDSGEIWRTV
ncbi:MAG: virulence factor SrfB [Thermodesulfobacteriota bacterium]